MFLGDIITSLPVNEKLVRMYSAFDEGGYRVGLRVISKDSKGNEHRYNVIETNNGTILQKND